MIKKFLLILFVWATCLFTETQAYAIAPINGAQPLPISPSVIQKTEPQILVSFRQNQSPRQLQAIINTRQQLSKNPYEAVKLWVATLFGKIPGLSYYQNSLSQIETTEKKAGVTKSTYYYSFQDGSNIYIMDLGKSTNINHAITLFQALPQVQNASIRTFVYPTSGKSTIQSITDTENIHQQILIQYKEGYTPPQVAADATTQAKIQSQPIIGSLRIASENLFPAKNPQEILNKYAQTNERAKVTRMNNYLSFKPKRKTALENVQVATVQSGQSVDQAVAEYEKLPEVEYATKRPVMYPMATPNDPYLNKEWGEIKMQAQTAWDTSTGSNTVTVAVVDSGVDITHPDLAGQVVALPGSNTCTPQSCPGETHLDPNNPVDDVGHGTHVSGTIGAIGNNALGVVGVNWKVKILAVKTMGPNGGDANPGIEFAIDSGAKIINLSLGGCTHGGALDSKGTCTESAGNTQIDPFTKNTLDDAARAGVTVVVAAGNSGKQDAKYHTLVNYNNTPGAVGKVIVVGATGPSDERASYSSWGTIVDIAAPGGNYSKGGAPSMILSTVPPSLNLNPNAWVTLSSGYAYGQGTSMATPQVVGAAALLLSINPNLTPNQIRNILVQTADPITTDKPIGPRLNLAKAVAAVSENITDNPTITTGITSIPTIPLPDNTSPTSPQTTSAPTAPFASPTLALNDTTLAVSVSLPGIGTGNGDNTNPKDKTRDFTISIFDANNQRVKQVAALLLFGGNSYVGTVNLGSDFPTGFYSVYIQGDNSLNKLVPGIITIARGQDTATPNVTLETGDVDQNNILDLRDYNILISCVLNAGSCTTGPIDLNGDGVINQEDLSILLRRFAQRVGF